MLEQEKRDRIKKAIQLSIKSKSKRKQMMDLLKGMEVVGGGGNDDSNSETEF